MVLTNRVLAQRQYLVSRGFIGRLLDYFLGENDYAPAAASAATASPAPQSRPSGPIKKQLPIIVGPVLQPLLALLRGYKTPIAEDAQRPPTQYEGELMELSEEESQRLLGNVCTVNAFVIVRMRALY